MQPLHYDLRCPAAKDKNTTHAAAPPSNLDAAITMRFAASRGQHSSLYAHGNRTRQQPCSHYTAICNQRIKKRIELRRHEQPLVAEHTGGTNCGRNGPSGTRRTHEVQVPFIAGCSHFTQRNARFRRAPAFFSNQNPCNIHAAITVASMLSIFLRVTLQFVSSAVRHVLTMYGL